jgi:ribosomal protein S27E
VAESLVRKRKRNRKGEQTKGRTAGGRGRMRERGGGRSRGGNPGEVGVGEKKKGGNARELALGNKKVENPGRTQGNNSENKKDANPEEKPHRSKFRLFVGPGIYHCLDCEGTTVVFPPGYVTGCQYCGSKRLWDSFGRPDCVGVPLKDRIQVYYRNLRRRKMRKVK